MTQVIYVKEYQPSSATLSLAEDPIYKQSLDDEHIMVGAPLPNWIIFIPIVGALLWLMSQDK